jgi:hypothetical protein
LYNIHFNILQECDLGDRSILHAVKRKFPKVTAAAGVPEEPSEEEGSKPLSETLLDLQLSHSERINVAESGT